MVGAQLVVNLKDTPLTYISGDNLLLTTNRDIVFPACAGKKETPLSIPNIVDVFYLNNLFIVVNLNINKNNIYIYNLSAEKTERVVETTLFAGIVQAGNMVYVFYDGYKVLAINSKTLEITDYTITLNGATQNIYKARQFNSQSFVLLTLNPTTIYINSILDLLSLSNTNTDITSFTYSTHAVPTTDIEIYIDNDLVYVSGKDGAVVLSVKTSDLVYLKTEYTTPAPYNPMEALPTISEVFGSGFKVDKVFSDGTYRLYNIVEDQYIYFHPIHKQLYFSNSYIYLNKALYYPLTGDFIFIDYDNINTVCELESRISVKIVLDDVKTLYKIYYTLQTMTILDLLRIQIDSKYLIHYSTYSYDVDWYKNSFIANVKGDTFIFHLKTLYPLRLNNLSFVFV
ncbi:MAG: hypothetical protein ACPL1B_10575 [Thermoprotei archaeon]